MKLVSLVIQEYSIRVSRLYNDPSLSWIIRKRFREFDEMNNVLKDYGYQFAFPKKKLFGNTDRIFMAERQKDLQVRFSNWKKNKGDRSMIFRHFSMLWFNMLKLCKSSLIQRFLSLPEHLVNYAGFSTFLNKSSSTFVLDFFCRISFTTCVDVSSIDE